MGARLKCVSRVTHGHVTAFGVSYGYEAPREPGAGAGETLLFDQAVASDYTYSVRCRILR